MAMITEQLDPGWRALFERELAQEYMADLRQFLRQRARDGAIIYPPATLWFNAFLQTPMAQVKVVIVGQDPYHGPGQAQGLSFSVPEGVPLPPSLKNIYKELYGPGGGPASGDLTRWARQGVLLLNASLTVEQGAAAAHAGKGWERFTARCVEALNQAENPLVFLAWGKFAHKVCADIDQGRHRVIKTSHPSPLGVSKSGRDFCAFLGSGCFDQANAQLQAWQRQPIDWRG